MPLLPRTGLENDFSLAREAVLGADGNTEALRGPAACPGLLPLHLLSPQEGVKNAFPTPGCHPHP